METQPQLRSGFKKINSFRRRLESWLYNYQGTLPIDAQLCFEQLGLEYNSKNYNKFYHALWEISKSVDSKVSFTIKDFYFAAFPTGDVFINNLTDQQVQEVTGEKPVKVTNDKISSTISFHSFHSFHSFDDVDVAPQPFDVLQNCYRQLARLPKEERTKILQSLTIML